jgi:bis(5'-nucleosyl)-tetraphosphatase (symmetrical)
MHVMYGNTPHAWNPALTGVERWRFAVNVFTRMRMVDAQGALDLDYKGELPDAPVDLFAWFDYPARALAGQRILFGHWSALGLMQKTDVSALDTGCIWGGALTALSLDNGQITQVPARQAYQGISD